MHVDNGRKLGHTDKPNVDCVDISPTMDTIFHD